VPNGFEQIASLAAQATHVERLLSPACNDCFAPSRETVQGRLRTKLGYPHSLVTGKTRNR
jgi:hypothetical protein